MIVPNTLRNENETDSNSVAPLDENALSSNSTSSSQVNEREEVIQKEEGVKVEMQSQSQTQEYQPLSGIFVMIECFIIL